MSPWLIAVVAGMAGGLIGAMVFRTGPQGWCGRTGDDGMPGPVGLTGPPGKDCVRAKPAKKKARRK